jgi:hypothetical protein
VLILYMETEIMKYMKKEFEYFLNAVHYCIYLEEIWSTKKFEGVILKVLHYLSRLLLLKASTRGKRTRIIKTAS